MFHRVFIANRGEVAVRVARTLDRLGITPVFGVSEADQAATYVRDRETVLLGPARASESYLQLERVVQAAVQSECTALHPGWGFLAESAALASLCSAYGVTFIGPSAEVIHLMGKKIPAKQAMKRAGLAVIPGSEGRLQDLEEARRIADAVGYPVILKAESGGGGRGMRIAQSPSELQAAFEEAKAEAKAAFNDDSLYLEKLIEGGRHIEVQLLADRYKKALHLGERDCSIQRKHQKLIEESPSPVLDPAEAATLVKAAKAAEAIGYVGAGTMEFLQDAEGKLRFMEMNTRLQVEHTVSEERSGVDLVEQQLRVAAGQRLALRQDDLKLSGHVIECRINAEDPSQDFRPFPGRITRWDLPTGDGIRVDTHVVEGYEVPPFYDSLLCKIIAKGQNRKDAVDKMQAALLAFQCEGVPTTKPMHQAVLASAAFQDNRYDTRQLPGWPQQEGA